MLYRSPNKRAAAGGIALAAGVVVFAGVVLFAGAGVERAAGGEGSNTERNFFAEIGTISRDFNAGTGEDRRILWDAGWKVFLEHPVLGVGAENFGPFAATYFPRGTIKGRYAQNPAMLYDRKLHNGYVQSLCEFGIVGSLLFIWLVVDFWRRNAALRTPRYRAAWDAATGGRYDLRWLALGLESGMVAFWGSAVFYNQLFEPWLYVLLTANALLHSRLTAALHAPVVLPGPAVSRT
jgi:O-antigen ligase